MATKGPPPIPSFLRMRKSHETSKSETPTIDAQRMQEFAEHISEAANNLYGDAEDLMERLGFSGEEINREIPTEGGERGRRPWAAFLTGDAIAMAKASQTLLDNRDLISAAERVLLGQQSLASAALIGLGIKVDEAKTKALSMRARNAAAKRDEARYGRFRAKVQELIESGEYATQIAAIRAALDSTNTDWDEKEAAQWVRRNKKHWTIPRPFKLG